MTARTAAPFLCAALFAVFPCASAQAAPAAEWTVMVYMNGKNDLEDFALADVNEMEAALPEGVNVVVELGRMNGYSSADGDWRGVRRYLVKKDADPVKINSELLADLGPADMGKPETLAGFGRWARSAYPAKKYMLVVWNHGSGWLKSSGAKGISFDYETGSHINTPDLGKALKEIGRVDVLAFDACLMQMAEVAYELKDSAEFITASEEVEAVYGYPYDRLLGALAGHVSMGPEELARAVVKVYGEDYAARGETYTHSYIKTAAMAGLRERADAFAKAVMAAGEKKVVKGALQDAICYRILQNTDLYDLARLITENTASPEAAAAGRGLMAYISDSLVGANTAGGPAEGGQDYKLSKGIAVYAPGVAIEPGYGELAWAKDSGWDEFIAWYLPFMR